MFRWLCKIFDHKPSDPKFVYVVDDPFKIIRCVRCGKLIKSEMMDMEEHMDHISYM